MQYHGILTINEDDGTAIFTTSPNSTVLLRVTHLPDPVPPNSMIDMVSLAALTSYHPVTKLEPAPPLGEKP
jgi:hypothetical protein